MSKLDLYPNLKSPPQAARVATGTDYPADKHALDVNVMGGTVTGTLTGEISISGLKTNLRTTTMNVSTTAIPLPAVALADRNAISVANLSATETIYIGFSGVTADRVVGTTSGWEVGPNENFNLDITDAIIIYAIVSSGTVMIKVLELA